MNSHRYLIASLLLAACVSPDRVTAPSLSADRLAHPDAVVDAGGSIQAAINAAHPGDVILIEPGRYAEAVHVALPGLTLMGRGGPGAVVIENHGGEVNGVAVDPGSDGDRIVRNRVTGNGSVASPIPFIPAADLLFVPAGTGNCCSRNRFGTSFPDPLPACS